MKEEEKTVGVTVMKDHQIGEVEEVMIHHLLHGVQKQRKEVAGESVKKQEKIAGVQGTVMEIVKIALVEEMIKKIEVEVDGVTENEGIVMNDQHLEETLIEIVMSHVVVVVVVAGVTVTESRLVIESFLVTENPHVTESPHVVPGEVEIVTEEMIEVIPGETENLIVIEVEILGEKDEDHLVRIEFLVMKVTLGEEGQVIVI